MMTATIFVLTAFLATAQTGTAPPPQGRPATSTAAATVTAHQPAANTSSNHQPATTSAGQPNASKKNSRNKQNKSGKPTAGTTSNSAKPSTHGTALVDKKPESEKTDAETTSATGSAPEATPGKGANVGAPATKTDQLESSEFGTGDESGTAAPTMTNGADAGPASSWLERGKRFAPLTAAVDFVLIALLIASFILLRRDTRRDLNLLQSSLDRSQRADPTVAVRAELANLRSTVEDAISRGGLLQVTNVPKADLDTTSRDLRSSEALFVRREPRPKFPILVADYVSQQAANAVRVKATQLDGELFARDHEGEFYLVEESDGALYVVPAHDNMTMASFKTYYRSSYDCTSPGSGDLYLLQPAEVSAKGDLWRLTNKGKLEARMS